MSKKRHIDWDGIVYMAILIAIPVIIIISMISYMSLNNWDLRCVFVECKPVRVIEEQNEKGN